MKNSASTGGLVTPGAGGAHLLGQLIDLLGSVDHDPDGEADAFAAGPGFGVPVAGELSDPEHCRTTPRTSNAANCLSSMICGQPSWR